MNRDVLARATGLHLVMKSISKDEEVRQNLSNETNNKDGVAHSGR